MSKKPTTKEQREKLAMEQRARRRTRFMASKGLAERRPWLATGAVDWPDELRVGGAVLGPSIDEMDDLCAETEIECATHVPGLTQQQSEALRAKAQELIDSGMPVEDVSSKICRCVCRLVGGYNGSEWIPSPDGRMLSGGRRFLLRRISVGEVEVEREVKRRAQRQVAAKRQAPRSRDMELWNRACRRAEKSLTRSEAIARCKAALYRSWKPEGKRGPPIAGFENLPKIEGESGGPPDWNRFRRRLFPKNSNT